MKQPEALRLADHLEDQGYYLDHDAAAELRRLHEVNTELVEAAKLALVAFKGHWNMDKTQRDRTAQYALTAALAKATGENND